MAGLYCTVTDSVIVMSKIAKAETSINSRPVLFFVVLIRVINIVSHSEHAMPCVSSTDCRTTNVVIN